MPDDRDDEGQAGGAEQREAGGLPRPELAQPEQGGHAADDDEQDEEERREPEPGRRQQAVEVEVSFP